MLQHLPVLQAIFSSENPRERDPVHRVPVRIRLNVYFFQHLNEKLISVEKKKIFE